jgi:hypothetical protein
MNARIIEAACVAITTLVTIRNNATERGQQKHGYLIGEADSTQQQRRSRQAINQP